ncbi:unnamed protein product [Withania somnifera]
MSNKSPIFPIAQSQHFSDDNYGFHPPQIEYFQILIDSSKKIKKRSHWKKWWRNALFFFKWKNTNAGDLNFHSQRDFSDGSIYGPVYFTESKNGSSSPCRRSFGRLTGSLTPIKKGDLEIPYVNIKECRISTTSATPNYLVT